MLLDAMLADQLIRRNLRLAAALAPDIDDLAPAEIIEGRIFGDWGNEFIGAPAQCNTSASTPVLVLNIEARLSMADVNRQRGRGIAAV